MTSVAPAFTRLRTPRLRRLPIPRDLLSRIAFGVLLFFILVAIFGSMFPVGNPDAIGVGTPLHGATWKWPVGLDDLGRNVFPRLVQGVRTTFAIAGVSVAISAVIGVLIGMVAAYYGGLLDELIARAADIMFSFPGLLFALLMVAIVGPGTKGAIIAIAFLTTPGMIRVIRAASLRVVNRDFVITAKVGGASAPRIIFVHLLPNVAGTAVVQGTYLLSVGMLIESGLSFLGLGVLPPQASLGSLVSQGSAYLPIAPRLVLVPGIVLGLIITSVNLTGDGLRDMLDVRSEEARN